MPPHTGCGHTHIVPSWTLWTQMAHVLLLWSVLHEAVTLGCILTGSYCTNIQQLRQIRSIFLFALPEEASVTWNQRWLLPTNSTKWSITTQKLKKPLWKRWLHRSRIWKSQKLYKDKITAALEQKWQLCHNSLSPSLPTTAEVENPFTQVRWKCTKISPWPQWLIKWRSVPKDWQPFLFSF